MSFPPGTEMFQFPGFASATYGFSGGYSLRSGLPHSEILGSKPARGSPRLFAACHVLHRLLAPRHPPDALAFLVPRQRPPQTTPRSAIAGDTRARARQSKVREGAVAGVIPATTTKRAVRARNGPHTHARCASCLQTEETKKNGRTRDLPMPVDARLHKDHGSLHAPCPQRAPLTTSRCPNSTRPAARSRTPRACGERLVGLGRLERPTSRLSGVRSNQLSYRPKHGERPEPDTSPREKRSGPAGRLLAKGRADGGGHQ